MSAARDINGPWLSRESMENLPSVHREFDLHRDPFIARQIHDLDKTESQRREEQSGGRQATPKTRTRAAPDPSLSIPPPANTQRLGARWLTAKRDAAMAQTLPEPRQSPAQQTRTRRLEPER